MNTTTLTAITERIKSKNYVLQVCLPCGKKSGKQTLYDIRKTYGNLETYVSSIALPNEREAIRIDLYSKNGSSFLKKESAEFYLNSSNYKGSYDNSRIADYTNTTTNLSDSEVKKVSPTNQANKSHHFNKHNKFNNNGNNGKKNDIREIHKADHTNESKSYRYTNRRNTLPITQNLAHTSAEIEAAQLKIENRYLLEKVETLKTQIFEREATLKKEHSQELERLKERNKILERRNDEYFSENLKLSCELATEKSRLELEYRQKELDLHVKQKQGLSGIMDGIKSFPPEAWQFLAGLLPNHPMSKSATQTTTSTTTTDTSLNGIAKHSDPDSQVCIECMTTLLSKQNPEIVTMAAMLNEHLVTRPKVLKAVYDKFFPEQSTKSKVDNVSNNGSNNGSNNNGTNKSNSTNSKQNDTPLAGTYPANCCL